MATKRTHEQFLEELRIKNDAYRNGEFELLGKYVGRQPPILLRDKYGYCEVRPAYLLEGSKTAITNAINKEEYLIEQFKEKRDFLYDYSKIKYKTQKTKIEIVCEKHGSFWQSPDNHKKGHGCKECALENMILGREVLMKRLKDFNKGYRYSVEKDFKLMRDYISVTCPHNHTYEQRAVDHLNGNGCPICADIFNALFFEKSTDNDDIYRIKHYVYFFKMYDKTEVFYKVGVAKDVKRRVSSLKKEVPYKIEILGYDKYSILECYNLENYIKNEFKNISYRPRHHFAGYTECFKENIYDRYLSLMYENYYKNISNE